MTKEKQTNKKFGYQPNKEERGFQPTNPSNGHSPTTSEGGSSYPPPNPPNVGSSGQKNE